MKLLWFRNKGLIVVSREQLGAIVLVQRCSMHEGAKCGSGNMSNFSSLTKLTTVLLTQGPNCCIVHIRVKCLWSGPTEESLSLSANYKRMLSAGQSDAEASWWISTCRGCKIGFIWCLSIHLKVHMHLPHIHTSTNPPTHTCTHTHLGWKLFPLGLIHLTLFHKFTCDHSHKKKTFMRICLT